MNNSSPTQLRFPASNGFSVRADFTGGAISTDFGYLLLSGIDHQTGLVNEQISKPPIIMTVLPSNTSKQIKRMRPFFISYNPATFDESGL